MGIKSFYIKIRISPISQWAQLLIGWTILSIHLSVTPIKFDFKWVFFYIATCIIFASVYPLLVFVYTKLNKDSKKWNEIFNADNPGELNYSGKKGKNIFPYRLPFLLKYILCVPAEDGLFLIPLFYTGINFYTAFISATLFAISHYPSYIMSFCIPKGVAYFFVALLILPNSGILPIIVGHLLIDLITGLGLRDKLGTYKQYYDDGTLKMEGHYKYGVNEGGFKAYYPSGKLHKEYFCSKGKIEGLYKVFFENGNLSTEGHCKDNEFDGLVRYYNEDGTLKNEINCKNEKIV